MTQKTRLNQRNGRLCDASSKPVTTRVAIYCRQSVDKGPGQDMTSCEAQRQAVEAYVESQRGEGWIALPEIYEDGGYSGATTKRPAFQRLMGDVESGNVDLVAVYKIDRISRSLLDFADIVRTFEKHSVGLVSVTQSFNTATSMGELVVNILMSFAQFERQQIGERIRDKVAAARRNGFWSSGRPPMGYALKDKRLVIVDTEAQIVREVFRLYLDLGSLSLVANELDRRGLRARNERRWDKKRVQRILVHPLYCGKVPSGDELFDGRHDAIVEQEDWDSAQAQLRRNGSNGGNSARNKHGVLLKGLLYCARCEKAMVHTYSSRGPKRYHYYICQSKNLNSPDACPRARVSARDIEGFVVEKIREFGKDPAVPTKTIEAAQEHAKERSPELRGESRRLADEIRRLQGDRSDLLNAITEAPRAATALSERLGNVDEQLAKVETRRAEVQGELIAVESEHVDENDIRSALAEFDGVWGQLVAKEKARLLNLLIERIDYDGTEGTVDITYRANGIKTLGIEATKHDN